MTLIDAVNKKLTTITRPVFRSDQCVVIKYNVAAIGGTDTFRLYAAFKKLRKSRVAKLSRAVLTDDDSSATDWEEVTDGSTNL
jgi:hypothetical protein